MWQNSQTNNPTEERLRTIGNTCSVAEQADWRQKMTIAEVLSLASDNPGVATAVVVAIAILGVAVTNYAPVIATYALIVFVALIISFKTGGVSYFIAFMLGIVTAFAEIISKFRDEPLKAFRTIEAVAYHTLNGCIAVFALYVLQLNGVPFATPLDQMNAFLLAGVGSMLVMRSRLFNVKVGDEEMAFGPEQIIKIYFRFMERAIDRVRAQSRIEFVRSLMGNLNFESVYDYTNTNTNTMLDSAQALSTEKRNNIEEALSKILNNGPTDPQLKSYKLGFLLLTEMGEDFLLELFQHPKTEWQISAPLPEDRSDGWRKYVPLAGPEPENVQFFSYGTSMDEGTLFSRLGWGKLKKGARKSVMDSAKKATLTGYRLEFNKPSEDGKPAEGWPSIVEDATSSVRGVLYRLPIDAFEHYAVNAEKGYRRRLVRVTLDGEPNSPIDAITFVAIDTRDGLSPSPERLQLLVKGAAKHALGQDYMRMLEAHRPAPNPLQPGPAA